MWRLLTVLVILSVSQTAFGEVVGQVGKYMILREGNSYSVVKKGKYSPETTSKAVSTVSKGTERNLNYHDVIYRLRHGDGQPVYSRIYGVKVERVLDLGDIFGAVVAGDADKEFLKKTFDYVVKLDGKYYVVGHWR